MKNKFVFSLLSLVAAGSVYASYPQKITACLTITSPVKTNNVMRFFKVGFVSTDAFDRNKYSKSVMKDKTCVSHLYSSGPKSISVGGGLSNPYQNKNIFLRLDSSCQGFDNLYPGWFTSPYLETNTPSVTWNFTLTQAVVDGSYPVIINVNCERINK